MRIPTKIVATILLGLFLFSVPLQFARAYNVATSEVDAGTVGLTKYQSFYACGRWWVFHDGNYQSSLNGQTWTPASGADGAAYVWIFNSSRIHAFRNNGGWTGAEYRMGHVDASGTLTWDTAWQACAGGWQWAGIVDISVDSDGYPWVMWRIYDGAWGSYYYAQRSDMKNGTWHTDATVGTLTIIYDTHVNGAAMTALLLRDMRFYYVDDHSTLYSKLFHHVTGLSGATKLSLDGGYSRGLSAVSDYNNTSANVVYIENVVGTYIVRFYRYTLAGGWSVKETVHTNIGATAQTILSSDTNKTDNPTLICLWSDGAEPNTYYYKRYYTLTDVWDGTPAVFIKPVVENTATYDFDFSIHDTIWVSQSFKMYNNASVASVEAYMRRGAGAAVVDVTGAIYAADINGKPTGGALTTGTLASFGGGYGWKKISFVAQPLLIQNSSYCVVISAPTGTGANYYDVGLDASAPTFADGNFSFTIDSGASWVTNSSKDMLFKVNMNEDLVGNAFSPFRIVIRGKFGVLFQTGGAPNSVMFAATSISFAPTIDEFTAPASVFAGNYFDLTATVNDPDGYGDISWLSVELTSSIVLRYDAVSGTFSLTNDPSHYCTLNVGGSSITVLNATAFRATFNIMLGYACPAGWKSVISTYTLVYDLEGEHGSDDHINLFYLAGMTTTTTTSTSTTTYTPPPIIIVEPNCNNWICYGLTPWFNYFGFMFFGIIYLTFFGATYLRTRKISAAVAAAMLAFPAFMLFMPAFVRENIIQVALLFAVTAAVVMLFRHYND